MELEKKEIQNLKGLLYFTDGDGIFPRKKPAYETAFVFLNRKLEKGRRRSKELDANTSKLFRTLCQS